MNNIQGFYLQAYTNYLKFLNQVGNNYDINILWNKLKQSKNNQNI